MLRFQGGGEGGGQVCQVVLRIHHVLFSRFSNLEGMYINIYMYIIYDVCVCIRGTNLITPHVTHTHTTVCTGYTGKLMLVCLSMRDERGIKINSTLVLTYMTL
jgi:hypothetical protein